MCNPTIIRLIIGMIVCCFCETDEMVGVVTAFSWMTSGTRTARTTNTITITTSETSARKASTTATPIFRRIASSATILAMEKRLMDGVIECNDTDVFVAADGSTTISSTNSNTNRGGDSSVLPRSNYDRGISSNRMMKKNVIVGPDIRTKPDYDNLHGPLGKRIDTLFMTMFRKQLARLVQYDSSRPCNDYLGIIEITQHMNHNTNITAANTIVYSNTTTSMYSHRLRTIHTISYNVLKSLFPPLILRLFPILFSKPFPLFSAKLNAYITNIISTWLMGETYINDIILSTNNTNHDNNNTMIGKNQGVFIKRCRFFRRIILCQYLYQ